MNIFQIDMPTKVYFGRQILEDAIQKEAGFFQGKLLIVTTGRSLNRIGYVTRLREILRDMPKVDKILVFDQISANPKLHEITRAAALGTENGVNLVVGFGGGSALDAAKATAAAIGMQRSAEELFFDAIEPDERTLPIVAIPTTAGTGSELSKAAIVSDEATHKKGGIRGRHLFPKLAIVDSAFTESVPFATTMETGFDVLAHAMESFISRAASSYTRMLSEEAVRIVGTYLPGLAENLGDQEAREQMSYAAMLMGINLGNASTALPHRMQYPLGAYTDSSHGAGLAALYPTWIFHEYAVSEEKVKILIRLLTGAEVGTAEQAAWEISHFLKRTKLPTNLRAIGVEEALLPTLTENVTGNLANDPLFSVPEIARTIYEEAWRSEW